MYKMCFYTLILLPFYRRYSTKTFILQYLNKICCLETVSALVLLSAETMASGLDQEQSGPAWGVLQNHFLL
jgi:hypothetical protein